MKHKIRHNYNSHLMIEIFEMFKNKMNGDIWNRLLSSRSASIDRHLKIVVKKGLNETV